MLNFKRIIPALFLTSVFLTTGCSNNSQKSLNLYGFGTLINIKYYGNLNDENTSSITNLVNQYDNAFDAHSENGLIYQINKTGNATSAGLIKQIMNFASEYKTETNNIFNPFLKSVVDLWKSSISNKVLPEQQTVVELNAKALNTTLNFSGDDAQLVGEGKIDLGGIAKGYLLKKLKPYFENKITDYIINAGSSSIMLGESSTNKEDGTYSVGIYKSSDTSPSRYLKQKNISIGTSSIYEQEYLKINDKTYSHCINGQTGSAQVLNDMVVVLGEDPIMCDVYSTVGMVSTIEQIKQIEQLKPLKFLVFSGDEITYQNSSIQVYTR